MEAAVSFEKPPFSVIKVEKKAEILYNVDNYIHKVEIQWTQQKTINLNKRQANIG